MPRIANLHRDTRLLFFGIVFAHIYQRLPLPALYPDANVWM